MGGVASVSALGSSIFTQNSSNATAKTVKAGASTIYQVEIDATANPGENVYAAFYNTTTPTVGTTAPRMLLPGKAGAVRTYNFRRGLTDFGTACAVATVTNEGGMGTGNPTGTVKVTVRFT